MALACALLDMIDDGSDPSGWPVEETIVLLRGAAEREPAGRTAADEPRGRPSCDHRTGVVHREEQVLVEALVAHPALEALGEGVLRRLAGAMWRQ
jgi:hypothetical protein